MSDGPLDAALARVRQGRREGRALYIRLYLIARRNHDQTLERQLKRVFSDMPQDDQAILEMVLDELTRALDFETFQAPSGDGT
jgi:hypothetical protein